MTRDNENVNGTASVPETPAARRPYEKPELRSEGVFETMALACGKISSTQAQCRTSLRAS